MKSHEKELILEQIEQKVGMIQTFHQEKEGASELLEIYDDYRTNGTSLEEAKLFLHDVDLFFATAGSEPETIRLHELREKKIRDEVSRIHGAKEEAIELGMKNKALDIAKKLIEKGMEKEEVSEITELPLSEIEKL